MQEKTFSFMAFPNCLWNVEDVDHFSNLRIFRKKDGGEEEAVKGNWRAVFALARSEEVLLKDAADCLF